MPRNRFVTPEVKRLDLSEGDWIEVKRRLNIAESKRIESSIFRGIQGNQESLSKGAEVTASDVELKIDPTGAYMTKLQVYLVAWSFVDEQGKPVKLNNSSIENLDPDSADEILEVLNAFLDEEEKIHQSPFTKKDAKQRSA